MNLVAIKFVNTNKQRGSFNARPPWSRDQIISKTCTQPLTYFECKKLDDKKKKNECFLLKKRTSKKANQEKINDGHLEW